MIPGVEQAPESLSDVKGRLVGRRVIDRRRIQVGVVRDVFITRREKAPVFVACERPWRPWRAWSSNARRFAVPVVELEPNLDGELTLLCSAEATFRRLDYHIDYLMSAGASHWVSLVEYLEERDGVLAFGGA